MSESGKSKGTVSTKGKGGTDMTKGTKDKGKVTTKTKGVVHMKPKGGVGTHEMGKVKGSHGNPIDRKEGKGKPKAHKGGAVVLSLTLEELKIFRAMEYEFTLAARVKDEKEGTKTATGATPTGKEILKDSVMKKYGTWFSGKEYGAATVSNDFVTAVHKHLLEEGAEDLAQSLNQKIANDIEKFKKGTKNA